VAGGLHGEGETAGTRIVRRHAAALEGACVALTVISAWHMEPGCPLFSCRQHLSGREGGLGGGAGRSCVSGERQRLTPRMGRPTPRHTRPGQHGSTLWGSQSPLRIWQTGGLQGERGGNDKAQCQCNTMVQAAGLQYDVWQKMQAWFCR
jgi:hypothetical protein